MQMMNQHFKIGGIIQSIKGPYKSGTFIYARIYTQKVIVKSMPPGYAHITNKPNTTEQSTNMYTELNINNK